MKQYFSLIAILFCLHVHAQNAWDYKAAKQKLQLPRFTASIDSVIYNNEKLKGKIVYIHFWYAACSPCMAELEPLNDIYHKLKNEKNFEFISFSLDSPEVINMLVDKYQIKYPVLYMPREQVKKMNIANGFPASIITDREGNIIYKRTGGSNLKKEAGRIIKKEVYPQIKKSIAEF